MVAAGGQGRENPHHEHGEGAEDVERPRELAVGEKIAEHGDENGDGQHHSKERRCKLPIHPAEHPLGLVGVRPHRRLLPGLPGLITSVPHKGHRRSLGDSPRRS